MKSHVIGLSVWAAFIAGQAHAQAQSPTEALPASIRAMIDAAAERDDPAVFAAVVSVARQAAPDHVAEIEALAAAHTAAEVETAEAPPPAEPPAEAAIIIAEAPPPPVVVWKGSIELGGSQVSGSTDVVGVYGSMDVSRRSDLWTHRVNGRADYQQTQGNPTTDRMSLAYQPQLALRERIYAYGLSQYDHDRPLGVDTRYTLGAGLGVTAADGAAVRIALDVGPALRRTNYTVLPNEETIAGRASLNIRWLASERLTVAQTLESFAERGRLNTQSVTSLDTRLFGPLRARLSYNLQYERDEPRQRTNFQTTSRASLLYSF
jgi:putative salt-induced outer membrane protein